MNEEVVIYLVYWILGDFELRLNHAVEHLAAELIEDREMVEANTIAQGEIRNAITAIEQEHIVVSYIPDAMGDDATQYFPRGE